MREQDLDYPDAGAAVSRRRMIIYGLAGASLAASGIRFGGGPAEAEEFELSLDEAEWRRKLSPAAFAVLRKSSTERSGSSPLLKERRRGHYVCTGCGLPLFSSGTKFESGTGWPSFYAPIRSAVRTSSDFTLGYRRVEVHCRRCGGHLGHVFDDGPKPTGKRYCINGVALAFRPA